MREDNTSLDEVCRGCMQDMGVQFKNHRLLLLALTHTSYANENGGEHNERLEFLGDAALGLIINTYLFTHYAEVPEGNLAKMKSVLVSDKTLAERAASLNIGSYLRLGLGEERSGGRSRKANLENAFEAIVGALYLDQGLPAASQFVLRVFEPLLQKAAANDLAVDAKSALQERVQKKLKQTPEYTLISSSGPEHRKVFVLEVRINGTAYGRGTGLSRKEAEQNAAAAALSRF